MGNAAKLVSKRKIKVPDGKAQTSAFDKVEKPCSEDVHEIVNLAMAIQKGEFIENMELWFACEKLPKMDTFSLTDPMIVSYQWRDNMWYEIGRTEIIPESLNPKFVKTLLVSYSLDTPKKLRFEVYDIDFFEEVSNLEKQELIGYIECDIHEIIGEPNHIISKPLINHNSKRKKNGVITVRGMEYDVTNTKYEFQYWGKDFAVRGDICLRFSLINESKEVIPFYTTDPEKNVKKGFIEWKPFQVPSTKFPDENSTIKIEAFEFNKSKGSIVLGEIEQSLLNLIENSTKNWIPFIKNGIPFGSLNFKVMKTTKNTFLNYILGGTDVSLIVGIDFSKSNKDPYDPASLHYINDDDRDNDYVQAMRSIIGFLQYYDHDNTIPVYGFGAKLPPYYTAISHCFAVNGNFFSPEIQGIEKLIKCYKNCVKQIKFHGPSAITELIKLTSLYARSEVIDDQNQKYFILLIFSDGSFSDRNFTVHEIAKASDLPLSIIIVNMGLNDNNLTLKIKNLEYETDKLPSQEEKPKPIRDIVSYVEFYKHRNDIERLAKETLSEIPQQFLDYMNLKKIKPLKGNQHLTAASHDFMHNKIEERKQLKMQEKELHIQVKPFILTKKEELINQLLAQNYELELINLILDKKGIPANDVNLAGQLISVERGGAKPKSKILMRSIDLPEEACELIVKGPKVTHKFFKVKNKSSNNKAKKLKKKNENYEKTKKFLEKMEEEDFKGIRNDLPLCLTNSRPKNNKQKESNMEQEFESLSKKTSIKKMHKLILSVNNTQLKMYKREENLCLKCRNEEIDVVFLPCGHASMCHFCCEDISDENFFCIICRELVENLSYFREEEKVLESQIDLEENKTTSPRKETFDDPNLKQSIVSFENIKTYEEIEEKFKGISLQMVNDKEEGKKEETILHMDSSFHRDSRHTNTLMMKSLEKKMKSNREKNIMFSDSIGGNVFKDYEKKTESEFSQHEDDIELEYLGI